MRSPPTLVGDGMHHLRAPNCLCAHHTEAACWAPGLMSTDAIYAWPNDMLA